MLILHPHCVIYVAIIKLEFQHEERVPVFAELTRLQISRHVSCVYYPPSVFIGHIWHHHELDRELGKMRGRNN